MKQKVNPLMQASCIGPSKGAGNLRNPLVSFQRLLPKTPLKKPQSLRPDLQAALNGLMLKWKLSLDQVLAKSKIAMPNPQNLSHRSRRFPDGRVGKNGVNIRTTEVRPSRRSRPWRASRQHLEEFALSCRRDPLCCTQGHKLATPPNNYICDLCGRLLAGHGLGCRICKIDLCDACIDDLIEVKPGLLLKDEAAAITLHELGVVCQEKGALQAAERHLTEALFMKRAVHGEGAHQTVAVTLHELGLVCRAKGDLEAAARLTESLTTCRELCSPSP